MDHSLRFSLLGAASFVLTTANPWVMVAAITSVTVIGTVGLVVRDNIFAGRNPDRCSRKLGGTVILYNELKLFVSLMNPDTCTSFVSRLFDTFHAGLNMHRIKCNYKGHGKFDECFI